MYDVAIAESRRRPPPIPNREDQQAETIHLLTEERKRHLRQISELQALAEQQAREIALLRSRVG